MADIPKWWMKGDWFDVCSCNIACPCKFAQAPTNNKCEFVLAYHIREGEYADVRLDALNVMGVVQFEGNAWAAETGIVDVGLYSPISVGKFRADRGRTRMNFPCPSDFLALLRMSPSFVRQPALCAQPGTCLPGHVET